MAKYKNKQGNLLPRCTQIIDVLGYNKRALMMWARKLALQGIDPLKKSKYAADLGTLIHKKIESHIYNATQPDESEFTFDQIAISQNGLEIYKEWEEKTKPEYLESEYTIITDTWGGTADVIMRIDGKIYLGDFKTSKAIYADHVIQVSAYAHGIHTMSEYTDGDKELLKMFNKNISVSKYDIEGVIIIHINKDMNTTNDNVVKVVPVDKDKLELGFEAFRCAEKLYNLQDKLTV